MSLYYHPNHKSSEHYHPAPHLPIISRSHRTSITFPFVTTALINHLSSSSSCLRSILPPPPLHHLLLLLFFLFSSSQRLLVRTCCSVRGPGHPAEHGCKGGPLRGERGGGVGRTLAQPPHKSHGVQGGRGAGHPSPRSAQGVRAAVRGRLQSPASGLEVAGYSEARFRQFK